MQRKGPASGPFLKSRAAQPRNFARSKNFWQGERRKFYWLGSPRFRRWVASYKLGDIDKGIDYYRQALAIDPNYTKVREYLGEAYLQKGDVAEAKEQLMEIADRCGGPCDDYELLAKAIAAHVTGEKIVDW